MEVDKVDTKALPIGIEDFKEMIQEDYYYVDKSLLIKELLDNRPKVSLFTRPRRFGKSLNVSMLQYFLEVGQDSVPLFHGLKIMDTGEKYLSHMNRYPVIMLSFKSADQSTFESSFLQLKEELRREFRRHRYLKESDKLENEMKVDFEELLSGKAPNQKYNTSISFLTQCLEQHFSEKVVILIDEYDVPLEKSYFKGYYEEMMELIRSMLNTALKTNTSLAFAVMTGCLRISKESIFTGLNNLDIISILSDSYGEFFGFTEQEIGQVLTDYQLCSKQKELKGWYNGYLFGNETVYNPWSVIKYLRDKRVNINCFPSPYWSNTSSNGIIRILIDRAGPKEKEEIENLIQGGTIISPVHEDVTYEDITSSPEHLWNFLFFTGYLKKCSETFKRNILYLELCIPNEEVRYIYQRKIEEWMKDTVLSQKHVELFKHMLDGDKDNFEAELNICLKRSISYMDSGENFYHGFLTGVFDNMSDYQVKSNRESGNGRGDIFVASYYNKKIAIIIEVKVATSYQSLENCCNKALNQIEEKRYEEELQSIGYYNILKYGIAFYKKDCKIKKGSN
jgi:hypothetical protein